MAVKIGEYVERPRVSRVAQWDGRDYDGMRSFCGGCLVATDIGVAVRQSNGTCFALDTGDYVVEHGAHKFHCVKKDDFEKEYEEVRYGF